MTKTDKANYIATTLEEIYPDITIPLSHQSAYTLLVAVILSAQCTDERVNQITPLLFSEADTPAEMVELGVDRVREIIRPCGLANNKSKNIVVMSQQLLSEHGGQVPGDLAELEKLAGVGHKTAAVLISQWFGEPAFPVDTHIHRLAKRWGLSSGKNVLQTERDLKKLFPREKWNKLHIQIILYGREYSPARGFKLEDSPIDKYLAEVRS